MDYEKLFRTNLYYRTQLWTWDNILRTIDLAIDCWGRSLIAKSFCGLTLQLGDIKVIRFVPNLSAISHSIEYLWEPVGGTICSAVVSNGQRVLMWYVQPADLVGDVLWKLRCGLVEQGQIADNLLPPASVRYRYQQIQQTTGWVPPNNQSLRHLAFSNWFFN